MCEFAKSRYILRLEFWQLNTASGVGFPLLIEGDCIRLAPNLFSVLFSFDAVIDPSNTGTRWPLKQPSRLAILAAHCISLRGACLF